MMSHFAFALGTSIPVSALIDLFILFFWMALVVAICYIVLILHRAYMTMKDVRGIIADNRRNINLILDEVPQITKNVAEVTTEVSHATQVFRPTVDNIAGSSESITHTFKENNVINETLVSAYKTVNNVSKLVDSLKRKQAAPQAATQAAPQTTATSSSEHPQGE